MNNEEETEKKSLVHFQMSDCVSKQSENMSREIIIWTSDSLTHWGVTGQQKPVRDQASADACSSVIKWDGLNENGSSLGAMAWWTGTEQSSMINCTSAMKYNSLITVCHPLSVSCKSPHWDRYTAQSYDFESGSSGYASVCLLKVWWWLMDRYSGSADYQVDPATTGPPVCVIAYEAMSPGSPKSLFHHWLTSSVTRGNSWAIHSRRKARNFPLKHRANGSSVMSNCRATKDPRHWHQPLVQPVKWRGPTCETPQTLVQNHLYSFCKMFEFQMTLQLWTVWFYFENIIVKSQGAWWEVKTDGLTLQNTHESEMPSSGVIEKCSTVLICAIKMYWRKKQFIRKSSKLKWIPCIQYTLYSQYLYTFFE